VNYVIAAELSQGLSAFVIMRLGLFVGGERSLPDINRLFAECIWHAERQRWEERPTRSEGETVH